MRCRYASPPCPLADSGDISLQELRLLLEQIFPDATRVQFATLMKDLRPLADNNNSYDEQSFLDAVMLVFQALKPDALNDLKFGKDHEPASIDKPQGAGHHMRVFGLGKVADSNPTPPAHQK